MDPRTVKYVVGLKLAQAGIHRFDHAAAAIGISRYHLCNILACRRRPAKHQAAIAKLCGCTAEELFGSYANPALIATSVLQEINKLKRSLIFLRKSVWPLREVVHGLTQIETGLLSDNAAVYYRDIYDHVIQVVDTIEAFRDTVSGMLDIYLSSLSFRLNEVMKVLTVIATIFMPLTFLAGIYGMNFNTHASGFNMPELNWKFGYFFALGIMATVACGMIFYFKKKRWF